MFDYIFGFAISNYSNGLVSELKHPVKRHNNSSANSIDLILCTPSNVRDTFPAIDKYDLLPGLASIVLLLLISTLPKAFDKSTIIFSKCSSYVHWINRKYSNILFVICCFMLFVMLLPLFLLLCVIMLCYRRYVYFIIKVSIEQYPNHPPPTSPSHDIQSLLTFEPQKKKLSKSQFLN